MGASKVVNILKKKMERCISNPTLSAIILSVP